MKRIALILAATALAGCGDSGTDDGTPSARASKAKMDYAALAETPKDTAISTAQFLSVCETFVADVDSVPHNEGDPNPMEVMRDMGADAFCACVETEIDEVEDRALDATEDMRNAPTRYMAHQLAVTEGTLRGRPSMANTVNFGRRIDTCFKSASAVYSQ